MKLLRLLRLGCLESLGGLESLEAPVGHEGPKKVLEMFKDRRSLSDLEGQEGTEGP